MTSALQKKADAFITKLVDSLTATSTPLPSFTAQSLSNHFQHTLNSLPPSKLRSHLLAHFPLYSQQLLRLYSPHLSPLPPLVSSSAFAAHLALLPSSVPEVCAVFASLLACSNCPLSVLHASLTFELDHHAQAGADTDGLRRALALHRSPATLLSCMGAVAQWGKARLTHTAAPTPLLPALLSSFLFLFQCELRALPPATRSASFSSQYSHRLVELYALQWVWSAPADILPRFASAFRYAASTLLPPPSSVNPGAELLLLHHLVSLRVESRYRDTAAVKSSPAMSAASTVALITALAPGIVRCLVHGGVGSRTVPLLRLAVLCGGAEGEVRVAVMAAFAGLSAVAVDQQMTGIMREAGVDSVLAWMERGAKALGEERMREVLRELGVRDDAAGGETAVEAGGKGGEEGGEEGGLALGWFDDRTGSGEGDDGQLKSLIEGLRDEPQQGAEEQVRMQEDIEAMMQQAGVPLPTVPAAEDSDDDIDQLPPSGSTEDNDGTAADGVEGEDESTQEGEKEGEVEGTSDTAAASTDREMATPSTTRTNRRRKAVDSGSRVKISPRHTRSGAQL